MLNINGITLSECSDYQGSQKAVYLLYCSTESGLRRVGQRSFQDLQDQNLVA